MTWSWWSPITTGSTGTWSSPTRRWSSTCAASCPTHRTCGAYEPRAPRGGRDELLGPEPRPQLRPHVRRGTRLVLRPRPRGPRPAPRRIPDYAVYDPVRRPPRGPRARRGRDCDLGADP